MAFELTEVKLGINSIDSHVDLRLRGLFPSRNKGKSGRFTKFLLFLGGFGIGVVGVLYINLL